MKVKEVAKDAWIMASGILVGCVFCTRLMEWMDVTAAIVRK